MEPEEWQEGDDIFGEWGPEGSEERKEVWLLHDQLTESEKKKFAVVKKDGSLKLNIKDLFKETSNLAKALSKKEDEIKDISGNYDLKITRIHRVVPALVNQELFDKVFGKDAVKSEEEFLAKLRETIQKNYSQEADHYTDHAIQDKLLENTTINVPENFYKKWILAVNKGELSEEDINKNYDNYLKELKWTLIFNRVSEDSGIKVEHDDVVNSAKDLIKTQFAAYGMSSGPDENLDAMADNYLKGKDGNNYYTTYNRVKSEKVMNTLREKLTINKKTVSPPDFLKAMEKTHPA